MARVDFYILSTQDEASRLLYVCRLVDKAWRLGHRVWIHAPDPEHAAALDERLWTFSQDSFLPHERDAEERDGACPVVIGAQPANGEERHLLVNEGSEMPDYAGRFTRIAEVVDQSPETRAAGRTRYREYRDAGYELHHHHSTS